MRRLIRADIRRTLLKISFYILPVIYAVLIFWGEKGKTKNFETVFMVMTTSYKMVILYFAGIPVFLSVYADELKAGAMQTAIGRGMSRSKIVIAKFLDVVILTAFNYLLYFICDYIHLRYLMIVPTELQMTRFVLVVVGSFLKSVSYAGIGSIFVYLTWNASIGLVAEILATSFSGMILDWIQNHLRIPAMDVSVIGQIDQATAGYAAGGIWIVHILAVIAYFAAFVLISIAIFNRKELEL